MHMHPMAPLPEESAAASLPPQPPQQPPQTKKAVSPLMHDVCSAFCCRPLLLLFLTMDKHTSNSP
jgi:hypothetical protein